MERTVRIPAFLCSAALVLGLALACTVRSAKAEPPAYPQYEALPCCELCPRAADPKAYDTKFLDSFKTMVQGKDGWLFRSESDLTPQVALTPEGLARLSEFHRALQKKGIELVIVVQPSRGMMQSEKLKGSGYPYDVAAAKAAYVHELQDLRARFVTIPDLEQLFAQQQGGAADYFSRNDHHWTVDGTRRTAELVAARIAQMPQFQDVKRQKFETHREGLVSKNATLAKAAKDLCGFGSPREFVPRFVTEAADGEGDLLGDEAVPQIALVGTSNSGPTYNFSGYISEYLQADVLNVSVVGGGMDGAMLSYLPSEEFRKSPPKILIWELQHFHNLGDQAFYRQAMPLLDDGCNGKDAVLEREVLVKPNGSTEVLFNGGGQVRALKSRDYVLDLQFSDPSMREMRGVVWYTSGNKENLKVEQSEHAPSQKGRFVTALRSDGGWGDQVFLGFDVQPVPVEVAAGAVAVPVSTKPADTAPLRLRARLCSANPAAMSAGAPVHKVASAATATTAEKTP